MNNVVNLFDDKPDDEQEGEPVDEHEAEEEFYESITDAKKLVDTVEAEYPDVDPYTIAKLIDIARSWHHRYATEIQSPESEE